MNKTSTQNSSENLNDLQAIEAKNNSGSDEYEPGKIVVDKILNYSKALSVRRSKIIGYVELLLN